MEWKERLLSWNKFKMFEFLEKLRSKPEKTRKLVAFSTALSFVGIIFLVWISILYPDWKYQKDKEDKITSKEPSPINTMIDAVSKTLINVKDQVSLLGGITSDISSTTFHYVSSTTPSQNIDIPVQNTVQIEYIATTSPKIDSQ